MECLKIETYEIMTPESVGVKKTSLVMGKHSGRHAFKDKLSDLGYSDVTDDVVQAAFGKFKILADKKKHIYDEDIVALVDDSLIIDNKINAINLKSLKFCWNREPQKAEMTFGCFWDIKKLHKQVMDQSMQYSNVLKIFTHTM
ncbi:hypothetical protein CM15mP35_00030 [bacterium]|nr:MAG: hypothetical protein CM15mP35_00030 [bacterium]